MQGMTEGFGDKLVYPSVRLRLPPPPRGRGYCFK